MRTRDAAMGMVFCLAVSLAGAADYFVAREHPGASDENPGTIEQPWKTLVHAGATAQAGDHVFIRGGVYRETLTVAHSGAVGPDSPLGVGQKVPDRIVFAAYGDEQAVIDGSEIVPAELWSPLEDSPGVHVADLNDILKEWLPNAAAIRTFHDRAADMQGFVFFNDALLVEHQTRNLETGEWINSVPGADDAMTRYYDPETGRLYVNLGGADPRATGVVEMTVRTEGVVATWRDYITIGKLTIRRVSRRGIEATRTMGLIIEDCHIHHVDTGFRAAGIQPIVRRNRIHHTINRATCFNGARGGLVQDNLVSGFGLGRRSYGTFAYTIFGGRDVQFYNNIAYQPSSIEWGGGFWTDCPGVGHIWMGNAAIHANFYIESPAFINLVQWNTVSRFRHQGIYLRANSSNLVRENLVEYSRGGLTLGTTDTPRHEVSGNVFVGNWLKQNRTGVSMGSERGRPGTQTRNHVQANVYEVPEGGYAAGWAGRSYETLEEFRAATGQETLGAERIVDYEELGLVWVRADIPGESHVSFPMFANPDFSRDGTFIGVEPYFWQRGDATGTEGFQRGWPRPRNYPFPGWADQRARPEQLGISRWPFLAPVDGTPVGHKVLHLLAGPDAALDEQGIGAWSPSMPTVSGAEIDISLWMKTEDVEPAAEGGGAVVYAEWSDWTGQNKTRGYVVGGDTEESLVNPEHRRGRTDWARVSRRLTAPEGAKRFALYLGLRSATGGVMYGAVEEIRTLPGEPPLDQDVATTKDDTPLVDPGELEFAFVDLSDVVNRALADEQADDGKGGWTDQGPGYDMPDLATGIQEHEGVPYKLLEPKTCLVLRSRRRPQSMHLPEQVTIPAGQTARVAYFLHSGAWLSRGHRHWRYEIHYADGHLETIPVVGGVNVDDWGAAGATFDFPNTGTRRTTVWPDLVANMLSPTCGLYVMEWSNPRPDVEIREIRMAAEPNGGVPILLAITLGRMKQ